MAYNLWKTISFKIPWGEKGRFTENCFQYKFQWLLLGFFFSLKSIVTVLNVAWYKFCRNVPWLKFQQSKKMLKICKASTYIIIKQLSNAYTLLPNVLWDLITSYITWKGEQNWHNWKYLYLIIILYWNKEIIFILQTSLVYTWNGLTLVKPRKLKTKTVGTIFLFLIFV